jgi:hypothetical protein
MNNYENLKTLVEEMEADVVKFYDKGVKSAGVRVRKNLQEIKNLAQTMRLEINDINKERSNG